MKLHGIMFSLLSIAAFVVQPRHSKWLRGDLVTRPRVFDSVRMTADYSFFPG
jgi:hypothetical protein